MLDAMRRNSRSWVIYLIFLALIVVFVLSFGPQAGRGGCSPSSSWIVKVDGRTVSETSWRFAIMTLTGGNASGKRARAQRIRETIADLYILRELAAREAERLGFEVSVDEARKSVLEGTVYVAGRRLDGKNYYYETRPGEETPRFNLGALERFAKELGLTTVDRLIEEQQAELLAQKAHGLQLASVRVSPEEVRRRFDEQNDKVEIEYVRFDPSMYRDEISVTAGDVDAYLAANDAKLKEKYEKEKARYTGLGKELRVATLIVKKPADAAQVPAAKAKADAALRRIKGGEGFDKVAAAVSEDEASAKRGGDLGWRPAAALRLGAQVADAAGKLEKGAVSEVIDAETSFTIIKIIDKREGDQSYDQVKRDLAEDALRLEKATAMAKTKADEAYAAAKGGAKLAELFPPPAADAPRKNAPRFDKGEGITRSGDFIPGIGPAPELVKALFEDMKAGDLYAKVFQTGDDLFVVRLTTRKLPDDKAFEKEKEQLASFLAQDKSNEFLASWLRDLCAQATARGEVEVNPAAVEYGDVDEKGNAIATPYAPCMTLNPQALLPPE
jgi:peptidyl-prolyl cis-trans isomerase D